MPSPRRGAAVLSAALVVSLVPTAATAQQQGDPTSDPLWQHQWGPRQVRADLVWPTTTGDGAVVAIVDSGVDMGHPDLAANIVGGADFTDDGQGNGNGRGNNGKANRAEGGPPGDWDPDGDGEGQPHGTHVAGIAAAVGGNGEGISGVAPDAGILSARVLGDDGSGTFEDVAEGIRWSVDSGADVINLSLGAPPGVQALVITGLLTDVLEAIEYANENGVVVVAAAGNESFPVCDEPSFDPGVLCVTATDSRELHTWYSNGGVKPDLLSVAAPGGAGAFFVCGEEILSTVPVGTSSGACYDTADYEEFLWFGTSMAAPHAAGAATLLSSMGCTREQILDIVTATARDPFVGTTGTWDPFYGFGIVDAAAAAASASTTCTSTTSGDSGGDTGEEPSGENSDPVATNDSAEANSRQRIRIAVLENDSDPDGDALTIASVTDPEHGDAWIDGDDVVYQADRGFEGTDTFEYTVSDGRGGSDDATVTVDVS